MIVVGIAGPTGSGKSTVCRILARRPGYVHVDCDLLAKRTYEPGGPAYAELVRAFGPGILSPDGRVDRKKLAELALRDPGKKKLLEDIVHPHVIRALERIVAEQKGKGTEVLLIEGALLFFSPHVPWELFDLRIWLDAPEGVRRRRLLSAGLPPDAVELRLRAQHGLAPPLGVTRVDASASPEEVASRVLSLLEAHGGSGREL